MRSKTSKSLRCDFEVKSSKDDIDVVGESGRIAPLLGNRKVGATPPSRSLES